MTFNMADIIYINFYTSNLVSLFKKMTFWHHQYHRRSIKLSRTNTMGVVLFFFVCFQTEQQLDCALDLMRRLPPQQIERNLSDLIDLVRKNKSYGPLHFSIQVVFVLLYYIWEFRNLLFLTGFIIIWWSLRIQFWNWHLNYYLCYSSEIKSYRLFYSNIRLAYCRISA